MITEISNVQKPEIFVACDLCTGYNLFEILYNQNFLVLYIKWGCLMTRKVSMCAKCTCASICAKCVKVDIKF